jgi:periplasmic divalent cation tolerance protein
MGAGRVPAIAANHDDERQIDPMTDLIAVYTTISNEEQAQLLVSAAIENNLAACVQSEPIRSIYRWQGQIERQDEIRLLLKPTRTAYPKLEKLLLELHPYELPAIFAMPACAASVEYTQWAQNACQQ